MQESKQDIIVKPVLTLGDLLRRGLGGVSAHKFVGGKPLTPTGAAHVCDVPDGLTLTPADLAMIAKDGPAKPAPAVIAPAPVSTTKPPLSGLLRLSAQGHRLGAFSGS
jgi:hypothetical protein